MDAKINDRKKRSFSLFWLMPLVALVIIALMFAFDVGGIFTAATDFLLGPEPSDLLPTEAEIEQRRIQTEWDKLRQAEKELERLEAQLKQKEEELKAMEEETLRLNEEAKALHAQLNSEVEDLMDLVTLYGKMEAKKAARILELLEDQETAVLILKNMKTDKAAAIIEAMQPEKAADISCSMFSR
jgi:flagellar motility protein MotE (MotC chaperone)